MVTTGAIETIRNPEQNRLAAAKLLLEWGHALLLATQQQLQEGWAETEKQSVIVVPIFLTGHQGDLKPHPDTPDTLKLDFSNFDSVENLVDRVLGPASGTGRRPCLGLFGGRRAGRGRARRRGALDGLLVGLWHLSVKHAEQQHGVRYM